jgi:hypothetical protein
VLEKQACPDYPIKGLGVFAMRSLAAVNRYLDIKARGVL